MQTSIHREAVEWSYEQNKSNFPRQLQCYHGIKANQSHKYVFRMESRLLADG